MTIKEISLITNDINGTATFYTTNLQLPIIYQSINRISFQAGASVLTFEQQTTATPPASVPEYADQIISLYKLPVFAKQPRMELFTALGDDNGLLIIAAESRNWFPSQIPAQPFPGTVTIENNGETNILFL